jgi:hypothetical protein
MYLAKVKPLIQVCSHPRSGTHFLEAFVGENFYSDTDLFDSNYYWGHWSNRSINVEGNNYGKLFGTHIFANKHFTQSYNPIIYIIRDGRAVALSIWKTNNFLNKNMAKLSFDQFIRTPLDWYGSPAINSEGEKKFPKYPIFEHWYKHIESWEKVAKSNPGILLVRYEELKYEPYKVYLEIRDKFFQQQKLKPENEISIISNPTGLLPNNADNKSWKNHFSEQDNDFFLKSIPPDFPYYERQ